MRGRKPIPTALHELRGTFNATRHKDRAGEPEASGPVAPAPDWMSETQRASWDYVVANAPAGILKTIDAGVLAVWVVAEDQHRAAAVAQARFDAGSALPMLAKDKNGQAIESPYVNIIHKAALRMVKAASELGFSPAARPRLGVQPTEDNSASPWAEFAVIPGGRAI